MVRVNRLNPSPDYTLFAKLEWANPFGSVKDRAAWFLLRDLEQRGQLGPGRGVVEATSGNTGISLAAMCAARGHHARASVPGRLPREQKGLRKPRGAALEAVRDDLCPGPGAG